MKPEGSFYMVSAKTADPVKDINQHTDGNFKIFLSETTRPRSLIFGIYHHLVDLYQVCSNDAQEKGPPRWSHVFHRLIYGSMKKSSCLKPQGLDI